MSSNGNDKGELTWAGSRSEITFFVNCAGSVILLCACNNLKPYFSLSKSLPFHFTKIEPDENTT